MAPTTFYSNSHYEECNPGYAGENCSLTCESGYFGLQCNELCRCSQDEYCDPARGCLCNSTIDYCREPECNPGYVGENCSLTCESGYFGLQCNERCRCSQDEYCDPARGYLHSVQNVTTTDKSAPCVDLHQDASPQQIVESVDKNCNPLSTKRTGTWKCDPGFVGENCSLTCPPGHFGLKCRERCQCSWDMYCDPIRGCVCNTTSVNCTDPDLFSMQKKANFTVRNHPSETEEQNPNDEIYDHVNLRVHHSNHSIYSTGDTAVVRDTALSFVLTTAVPLQQSQIVESIQNKWRLPDVRFGEIVRTSKVDKQNMIKTKFQTCLLADGSSIRVPVASIFIDTPYITGTFEACCMEKPVYDLIIGNVGKARPPGDPDTQWLESYAVEIRRMQAKAKLKPRPQLKVPKISSKSITPKDNKVEQQTCDSLQKVRPVSNSGQEEDYKIDVKGKSKTFHVNMVTKYILTEMLIHRM
uniref:Multiple epidermal growth factor-like domains 6 n=1 Tax=Magallana gigas TaxID=29159 RepID=K1Q8N5_MAGGI